MEESISYLLPLALLLMASQAGRSEADRSNLQFEWILGCGFLLLAAVVAWVTGPLVFDGPAFFELNSLHQIQFQLQADWLVLGILASFFWLSAAKSRTSDPRSDGLIPLAVALFLLANNFGLQFLAGGWLFGLIVLDRVRRDESIGIDAGLGLCSILLLLLCMGLLEFDLDVSSWTALNDVLTTNERVSEHELSALKLASLLLVFSTAILMGLAPLQAFWIDERTVRSRGMIRFLLALILLHRGRELILWTSTGDFAISLAFATFVMTAICAPFQRNPNRRMRAMTASHVALAMTGLLGATDVIYAAGVCHVLVACSVCCVLSNDQLACRKYILGVTLLILFGGFSGAFVLLDSSTHAGIAFESIGWMAWMCQGLTQTRLIQTQMTAADSFDVNHRMTSLGMFQFLLLLGIAPIVFSGYCVTQFEMASTIFEVWLVPEALLVGAIGVAIAWSTERSISLSERLSDRAPGVVRLLEHNIYLSEFVMGAIRIPGTICLGMFGWSRDAGPRLLRKWGEFRRKTRQSNHESVRWELIRGVVCVVALLIVFLWIDW